MQPNMIKSDDKLFMFKKITYANHDHTICYVSRFEIGNTAIERFKKGFLFQNDIKPLTKKFGSFKTLKKIYAQTNPMGDKCTCLEDYANSPYQESENLDDCCQIYGRCRFCNDGCCVQDINDNSNYCYQSTQYLFRINQCMQLDDKITDSDIQKILKAHQS